MFFFRRGKGPRVRLPDDTQSQAFRDAYEAALTGKAARIERKAQVPSDTLEWLVDRYMESAGWSTFSPATRRKNGLIFKDTLRRSGNPPYAAITRRTIEASIDARKDTPAQANNWLKAMRRMFQWAVKNEHLPSDPSEGVEYLHVRTDGFKPWTLEDAAAFCEHWPIGTKPRLAFELFLVTGLRRSDVGILGPQHVKEGVLTIRATKPPHHQITVHLPAYVRDIIAATETGDMVFITSEKGTGFASAAAFGNWFSARCRDAGIVGKSAHGIRKLSATLAADAGATTHELMAHFGWSHPAQAETYTRGADRARLGTQSSKRLAEEIENMRPRTMGQAPRTGGNKS
jgi:integrase